MMFDSAAEFCYEFTKMSILVHENAVNKGFWESDRSVGESIALIHSELSEALEGDRKDLKDEHLPEFDSLTVELADAVIRIMDLAQSRNLNLGAAIANKHEFNLTRPH